RPSASEHLRGRESGVRPPDLRTHPRRAVLPPQPHHPVLRALRSRSPPPRRKDVDLRLARHRLGGTSAAARRADPDPAAPARARPRGGGGGAPAPPPPGAGGRAPQGARWSAHNPPPKAFVGSGRAGVVPPPPSGCGAAPPTPRPPQHGIQNTPGTGWRPESR